MFQIQWNRGKNDKDPKIRGPPVHLPSPNFAQIPWHVVQWLVGPTKRREVPARLSHSIVRIRIRFFFFARFHLLLVRIPDHLLIFITVRSNSLHCWLYSCRNRKGILVIAVDSMAIGEERQRRHRHDLAFRSGGWCVTPSLRDWPWLYLITSFFSFPPLSVSHITFSSLDCWTRM